MARRPVTAPAFLGIGLLVYSQTCSPLAQCRAQRAETTALQRFDRRYRLAQSQRDFSQGQAIQKSQYDDLALQRIEVLQGTLHLGHSKPRLDDRLRAIALFACFLRAIQWHQVTPACYYRSGARGWFSEGVAEYVAVSPYTWGRFGSDKSGRAVKEYVTGYGPGGRGGRALGSKLKAPGLKGFFLMPCLLGRLLDLTMTGNRKEIPDG